MSCVCPQPRFVGSISCVFLFISERDICLYFALLQTPTVVETVAEVDLISANGHLLGSEVISDRMYIGVGPSMRLPVPVTVSECK